MTHPHHDQPESPITSLAALAIQLHEFFRALVAAGFTEEQAMRIVLAQVGASRQQGTP